MELLNKFLNEYATLLLYTALTAIFGLIAAFVKKKYNEWANTKIKKEVVKTCVTAVQQLYQDLDGPEKKEKAIESISEMLAEKGIAITPLEINMLIEACIGEFKGVFDEVYVYDDSDVDIEFTPDKYIDYSFVPLDYTVGEDEGFEDDNDEEDEAED